LALHLIDTGELLHRYRFLACTGEVCVLPNKAHSSERVEISRGGWEEEVWECDFREGRRAQNGRYDTKYTYSTGWRTSSEVFSYPSMKKSCSTLLRLTASSFGGPSHNLCHYDPPKINHSHTQRRYADFTILISSFFFTSRTLVGNSEPNWNSVL
jgi:hypothetical protein